MQSPLISFESPEQLHRALDSYSPLTDDEVSSYESLVAKRLPPIVSAGAFGAILGINPKLLTAMAKFTRPYYREFPVSKKGGGTRKILAPRTFLKTVQKYILTYILLQEETPSYVTGFIRGRGPTTNGLIHKGARYLLNVDIENFFGSVTEQAVRELFQGLGYSPDIARLFMHLCTFDGSLPQGAPTSPALSNLVFAPVDRKILALCSKRNLKYSRYADDMSFSGSSPIPKEVLRQLKSILKRHGFKINAEKTRFSRPGQAKYVTGLVVNEQVQAPRELRRKLRAMFHGAKLQPAKHSDAPQRLMGWASFVNSYDRKLGAQYLEIARRVQSV